MNMSKYELSVLKIIRDEVNAFLQTRGYRRLVHNSNIPKVLTQTLPKLTGKVFEVTLNTSAREPFVMAAFPDIAELDKISQELLNVMSDPKSDNNDYLNVWGNIQHWHLEIDARILVEDCPLCVRSGNEFVAILCHEIGHVMLEDPFMLVSNYKKHKATMDKFNKLAACNSKFVRKFMLPVFVNTLSFRIHSKGFMQLPKEIAADGYVPNEYRGDLLNYLEDCILSSPDSHHLITNTETYNSDQEVSIKFSEDVITLMRNRVDTLKHHMSAQYADTSSGSTYLKKLTQYISKVTMAYDAEKEMPNMIMESTLYSQFKKEMAVCEQKVQSVLESIKVTDRDLSILEVQCAEVKVTEDKIYLIHTIYDYIEAIQKENAAKLKKAKDTKVKDFIKNDDRLTRLNRCREIVMSKDTSDVGDQYGVFVRYPKGYEG